MYGPTCVIARQKHVRGRARTRGGGAKARHVRVFLDEEISA